MIIKLVSTVGVTVWVNSNSICSIIEMEGGGSIIYTQDGRFIDVKEEGEYIEKLCSECLGARQHLPFKRAHRID